MSELSIQVNYVKLICSGIIDPYHAVLPWNVDDEVNKSMLLWCCLWFSSTFYILNFSVCTNFNNIVFHKIPRNFILYRTKISIKIIFEAISFNTKKISSRCETDMYRFYHDDLFSRIWRKYYSSGVLQSSVAVVCILDNSSNSKICMTILVISFLARVHVSSLCLKQKW